MRFFIITLLLMLNSFEIRAQLGYRYEGKFIELTPCQNEQYYVLIRSEESKSYLESIIKEQKLLSNKNGVSHKISENSYFVSSKPKILQRDYISEQFRDSRGNPYYILPRIIISIDDNANIIDILKGYLDVLTIDSVQKLRGMYTITCNLSSAKDVLRIVGKIDNINGVKWCEPDMICLCHGTGP